jgi:hypothetical protein
MSEAAIEGSMDIWREYAKNMNHERGERADAVIEQEINLIEEERESEAEAEAEREREREGERERKKRREKEKEKEKEKEQWKKEEELKERD